MSIVVNRVFFSLKIINRLANSVDPDETAHYEPSHLDLHCLHRHLYQSMGLKGLIVKLLVKRKNAPSWQILSFKKKGDKYFPGQLSL